MFIDCQRLEALELRQERNVDRAPTLNISLLKERAVILLLYL